MRKMLAVLAAMIMSLTLAAPANADPITSKVDGCNNGYATLKADAWGKDVHVFYLPGATDLTARFRLGAYSRYWHCPNGTSPNKAQFTGMSFCATKLDSLDPESLEGFKYNPYYFNSNNYYVNPPEHMLNWNGAGSIGDQRCTGFDIADANRKWWFMSTDPAWTLSGWTVYTAFPDAEWHFGSSATTTIHYIDPPNDANVDNGL